MKSKAKIKAEIDKLSRLRVVMPPFSAFGNDNHARIDAEKRILEGSLTMDEDKLREKWDLLADDPNDPRFMALDWVLEEVEDDLVDEDDIAMFAAKQAKAS